MINLLFFRYRTDEFEKIIVARCGPQSVASAICQNLLANISDRLFRLFHFKISSIIYETMSKYISRDTVCELLSNFQKKKKTAEKKIEKIARADLIRLSARLNPLARAPLRSIRT